MVCCRNKRILSTYSAPDVNRINAPSNTHLSDYNNPFTSVTTFFAIFVNREFSIDDCFRSSLLRKKARGTFGSASSFWRAYMQGFCSGQSRALFADFQEILQAFPTVCVFLSCVPDSWVPSPPARIRLLVETSDAWQHLSCSDRPIHARHISGICSLPERHSEMVILKAMSCHFYPVCAIRNLRSDFPKADDQKTVDQKEKTGFIRSIKCSDYPSIFF